MPLKDAEDIVHYTYCKASWDIVIVILSYINEIDLIWVTITALTSYVTLCTWSYFTMLVILKNSQLTFGFTLNMNSGPRI